MFLFSIAYFFQFFYFLKFAGQAKKRIQLNDSILFNKSLAWMYRAFCLTAIGVSINGLYVIYVFLEKMPVKQNFLPMNLYFYSH